MKREVVLRFFGAAVLFVSLMTTDTSAFSVGDTIKVIANTNVRTGPGTSYSEIKDPDYSGTARAGTAGKITAGPQRANGYTWWKVDFGPGLYAGWAVQDGLEIAVSPKISTENNPGKNPLPEQVYNEALRLSKKYKIPAVIIMAAAYQENEWRHFKDNGEPEISPVDGGIGMMQITPDSAGQWPHIADVILGQQQGDNAFTIVLSKNQKIDDVRLNSNWQYNLEIGCQIFLAKRIECKGQNDDASILENWYYPLMYYNGMKQAGANDPANAKYSRSARSDSDWKSIGIFPYQECVFNIIAQKQRIPDDIQAYFGRPIVVTLPGPEAVKKNGYTYVDDDFSGGDFITFFGDGKAEIKKLEDGKLKSHSYSNVCIHRVGFGSLEVQDVGCGASQELTSTSGTSSETYSEGTNIIGKWVYANDSRLAEISTLEFIRDGSVVMSGPFGNVRLRASGYSSGEWQVEKGKKITFNFTEHDNMKASAQIDNDKLIDFKTGDFQPGPTLVKSPNAQEIQTTSKGRIWTEYISENPQFIKAVPRSPSMSLKMRTDKSFLVTGSVIWKWKIVDGTLVRIYGQDENGNVIEHSMLEIKENEITDNTCNASYIRKP